MIPPKVKSVQGFCYSREQCILIFAPSPLKSDMVFPHRQKKLVALLVIWFQMTSHCIHTEEGNGEYSCEKPKAAFQYLPILLRCRFSCFSIEVLLLSAPFFQSKMRTLITLLATMQQYGSHFPWNDTETTLKSCALLPQHICTHAARSCCLLKYKPHMHFTPLTFPGVCEHPT